MLVDRLGNEIRRGSLIVTTGWGTIFLVNRCALYPPHSPSSYEVQFVTIEWSGDDPEVRSGFSSLPGFYSAVFNYGLNEMIENCEVVYRVG